MIKTYQGMKDMSKGKFEVLGKRKLLEVPLPLPLVEVWEELQAQVEQLTGEAGFRIIGTILENEVAQRVGPPHRPDPVSGVVRWGRQSGYVVFGGRKVSVERLRVRTREGQEVELDSIDGILLGKQVLVVALGMAGSGEKHVLWLWQGATERKHCERGSNGCSGSVPKCNAARSTSGATWPSICQRRPKAITTAESATPTR